MIKGRIYFLENKELTGFEKYKNEGRGNMSKIF